MFGALMYPMNGWSLRILLFCSSVLFSASLYGQTNDRYSSFVLENKEVIWVQLYDAQPGNDLPARVFDFLKRKAWIEDLRFDGSDLVADIVNFRVDYKRYGGKYMNTSNLIRTARWSGKIRISFTENKYRVIVYGLEYDGRQPAMHAGKMSNQPHEIHGTWTDWVLNNYRTHFKRSRHTNMDMMHFNLKDGFAVRPSEYTEDL